MAKDIKAHLFWVRPPQGSPTAVENAVLEFMKKPESVEFSHQGQDYMADSLTWLSGSRTLVGTIYRLRDKSLPVAVHGTKIKPLPLQPEDKLGEPMCFAFLPVPGAAIVHYSHTGPRHPALQALISRLGFADGVVIEPCIREDILDELEGKSFLTAVEFALEDPAGSAELRNAPGPVKDMIRLQRELGGVNVRIEVTMGHKRGDGLLKELTKGTGKWLRDLAFQDVAGDGPVKAVKITGKEDEDSPVRELDLLHAREVITLTVSEQGRHLDRTDCQRKLRLALDDRKASIVRMAGRQR